MAKEMVEVPITGKIMSVEVEEGDTVNEGDVICYIESMKMENPIMAPLAGTINRIEVSAGQTVETGNLIAVIDY